ncbi:VOC family protein [Alkalihalobacterium bogoriense]|uniref:VOC family protein n=1 Tax=Alkalihalobacterium bogoriense TaxID=246272 RepID=UPI00047C949F|nr:VOC family protein [Alkalihalobacterium bogoriense]
MKEILSRIDCTFIPVHNIPESIDWYVNNLGCKFMWHDGGYAALNINAVHPEEGQGNIVLGQAMITLVQADDVTPLTFTFDKKEHPVINFYTKDIEFTYGQLKKNGVEVSDIHTYGPLKSIEFKELNGHLLGVCCF